MHNEVVGKVFSTRDYGEFKKLNGNRSVLEGRKEAIKSSIIERGWVRNPIVVNGQGRFEALQELGMPIEYVISEGATIDDCIALNIKQKNWQTMDYIKCYADIGRPEYVLLNELIEKYKGPMNLENIVILVSQNNNSGNTGTGRNRIKNGTYKLLGSRQQVEELLTYATRVCNAIGKQRGRLRTWIPAIKFAFFCDSIDHNLLLEKMQRLSSSISVSVSIDQALGCLEKIYNYNARGGSRVYFMSEYDKYMHKKEKFDAA